MKYIWVAYKEFDINISHWKSLRFPTNSRFNFGDKVFINSNGYCQKRKTNDFIGWFMKYGNLNILQQLKINEKLLKIIINNPY
jgi:hypothetical protein